jgi:hypothetical protein
VDNSIKITVTGYQRNALPRLRREFIGAAVVLGLIAVGAFAIHWLFL